MAKWKKAIALSAAILMSATLGFVACSDKEDSSSSSSSSNEPPIQYDTVSITDLEEHEWVWTLNKEATCTEDGTMSAECKHSPSHKKEIIKIEKLGHEYDDGVCIRCEATPTLPAVPSSIHYTQNFGANNPFDAAEQTGEEYNRYEVTEGYYEFEITNGSEGIWVSLSMSEAGQYAIYSVDGNPDGVTAVQHAAHAHYVTYPGDDATVLADGNFFSDVNCAEIEWSVQARSTWHLQGEAGDTVKVRFARIDAPAWRAQNVNYNAIPREINGKKAPEADATKTLKDVPYSSEYFFDEENGYYRMGTADNPGDIIYMAITADAMRLLGEISFVEIQNEGNNLSLYQETIPNGNHLVKNYSAFLMNSASTDGNCYENYVNSDGVYPVTKELHDFLDLYVKRKAPELYQTEENAWLSACYYYKEVATGTEDRPLEITSDMLGQTIETTVYENGHSLYYVIYPADMQYCTISSTDDNIFMQINGENFEGAFTKTVEIPQAGLKLCVSSLDFTADTLTFTVTVSEAPEA